MSTHSPAPGTPQTSYKAYAATALTVVTSFVMIWVADEDPFTLKEAAAGVVAALGAGGVIGGVTHAVRNKATARH